MLSEIRNKFHYVDSDPLYENKRLYFDNGGGALRLKKSLEAFMKYDSLPYEPQEPHLEKAFKQGMEDVKTIFNAKKGSIITEVSASQVMFQITEKVIKNIKGTNVVVTEGDHPSSFDAATIYSKEYEKELRIAKTNSNNGGTDVEEILKHVDSETCLLSIIYASNLSGRILDVNNIIRETRKINPDLYIILDGVQFAPHSLIDVEFLGIDGINFAPYKFFSTRGIGFGYLSDRLSVLPHYNLLDNDIKNWTTGSPMVGSFAAISEVVNYVCWIGAQFSSSKNRRELFEEGMNKINSHERYLMNRMLEGSENVKGLKGIPNVTLHFDTEDLTNRELLIAMNLKNLSASELAEHLDKRGFYTVPRTIESVFAKRQLASFGIDEMLRVTPMHYNTPEEIDQFLQAVNEISKL